MGYWRMSLLVPLSHSLGAKLVTLYSRRSVSVSWRWLFATRVFFWSLVSLFSYSTVPFCTHLFWYFRSPSFKHVQFLLQTARGKLLRVISTRCQTVRMEDYASSLLFIFEWTSTFEAFHPSTNFIRLWFLLNPSQPEACECIPVPVTWTDVSLDFQQGRHLIPFYLRLSSFCYELLNISPFIKPERGWDALFAKSSIE
jgi:hypothetical protein